MHCLIYRNISEYCSFWPLESWKWLPSGRMKIEWYEAGLQRYPAITVGDQVQEKKGTKKKKIEMDRIIEKTGSDCLRSSSGNGKMKKYDMNVSVKCSQARGNSCGSRQDLGEECSCSGTAFGAAAANQVREERRERTRPVGQQLLLNYKDETTVDPFVLEFLLMECKKLPLIGNKLTG